MKYDFIFIVLVYRNTDDLLDFFKHFHLTNTKVIVVNSFYDYDTERTFKHIADNNGAVFISVPNKGYGAGNNRGIEYALATYDFKYLVVSNADVIIKQLNIEDLIDDYSDCICAPDIVDIRGKHQNPHMAFRRGKFFYSMRYWMHKNHIPGVMFISSVFSRLSKIIFYILNKLLHRDLIYAAHGAFVIFPFNVIHKLVPLYNEDMFLFGEETHVGLKAENEGIATKYNPRIIIMHKEDGSVSLENISTSKIGQESYEKLYEYWFK